MGRTLHRLNPSAAATCYVRPLKVCARRTLRGCLPTQPSPRNRSTTRRLQGVRLTGEAGTIHRFGVSASEDLRQITTKCTCDDVRSPCEAQNPRQRAQRVNAAPHKLAGKVCRQREGAKLHPTWQNARNFSKRWCTGSSQTSSFHWYVLRPASCKPLC